MPDPLSFIPQAVAQAGDRMVFAEVSLLQSPPSSFSDPLYVVFPDFSRDYFFEIANWPQLHGATLPQAGGSCLIAVDNRGTGRVVWWGPPGS